MKIMIHSPFDTGDYLGDLIHEKVNKLNHFFQPIERVDVYLREEAKDKEAGKIVEMRAHIPGHEIFAEKRSPKFESCCTGSLCQDENPVAEAKANRIYKKLNHFQTPFLEGLSIFRGH